MRVPRGFTAPSEYALSATVELPEIGLTGEINLGKIFRSREWFCWVNQRRKTVLM